MSRPILTLNLPIIVPGSSKNELDKLVEKKGFKSIYDYLLSTCVHAINELEEGK